MSQTDLDDLLRQLHSRLGAATSLDAEDRRRLTTALRDIETALGKADARPSGVHGLEALAVKFEVDHPALADGLRRVADALGKAGI